MKIYVIHGHRDHAELARAINDWTKTAKERRVSVLDIDYGYTTDGSWGWYSAMIRYEERTGGLNEVQVHIFHGHREYGELQSKVNAWLIEAETRGIDIVDIKYGYTTDRTWGWYSAMVIYKSRY